MNSFKVHQIRIFFALIAMLLSVSLAWPFQWGEEGNLFWPPPPEKPRIYFIKNIATTGKLDNKNFFFQKIKNFIWGDNSDYLINPAGIAIGGDGILYFTDTEAGSVTLYSLAHHWLQRLSTLGKDARLVSPIGVGVSREGIIFLADSYLKKVFAFHRNGQILFALGEEAGLQRPTGLFVRNDQLYVVDTLGCQVFVFDLKGKLLFVFGGKGKKEGQLNAPTYIFVDQEQKIYVSDTLNFRVQIFDPKGRFLKSIGTIGDSSGSLARPKGVAVDAFGHIYIVDAVFDNVQVFDLQGRFLLNFGNTGSGEGEFWLPSGIAVDQENNIYIADTRNQRIGVYQYRD